MHRTLHALVSPCWSSLHELLQSGSNLLVACHSAHRRNKYENHREQTLLILRSQSGCDYTKFSSHSKLTNYEHNPWRVRSESIVSKRACVDKQGLRRSLDKVMRHRERLLFLCSLCLNLVVSTAKLCNSGFGLRSQPVSGTTVRTNTCAVIANWNLEPPSITTRTKGLGPCSQYASSIHS